ncbi:uncharacterized protein LOC129922062 [Biomphalaria glabrata]|uniref:Uncharacterized protein LOC129922062 n=1 Tax=Biomphalaria glabrata TaxID=6526 RepID=A0A9W2YHU8_BIOGL|nr:uncharacterized protein LOC129922062 [Biomphalaria glabrata]
MNCKKETMHTNYIDYRDFLELSEQYREKIFEFFTRDNLSDEETDSLYGLQNLKPPEVTSVLIDDDFNTLHNLLKNMSDLTGLILIMSQNHVKHYGTGFIVKIRRQINGQCPCPDQESHNELCTEHAIVTVSTAYHIFSGENETDVRRYKEIDGIWNEYKTQLKLYYNGDEDKSLEEIKECTKFPTLYGHKLIEMDKDLDYDCDWCAIECVTHDTKLIKKLEGTLSQYQSGLKELYNLSLTKYTDVDMVVIIGHPHNWSLRFSFGNTVCPNKEELKVIRSNQLWCRYYYDNLTCKGSSGSPIFKWGQSMSGFGYWFGHSHNHSEGNNEDEKGGKSTIGVENIV